MEYLTNLILAIPLRVAFLLSFGTLPIIFMLATKWKPTGYKHVLVVIFQIMGGLGVIRILTEFMINAS